MKKKIFIGLLMLGMLISFCNVGVAQDKGTVYNLKFSTWDPAASVWARESNAWADRIAKRTNGKVKIQWYFSQALSKIRDQYRSIQSGIADGGFYVVGFTKGIHRLNEMLHQPFFGFKGQDAGYKLDLQIRKKFPEFDKELETTGVKRMFFIPMPSYDIHLTTDKRIGAPTDMRGMKIMADPAYTDVFRTVNAAVTYYGPPDWYENLNRGLVQAHITHWTCTYNFQLLEVEKSHTLLGPSGCQTKLFGVLFNNKIWNSLPVEYQKIIEAESDILAKIMIDEYVRTCEMGKKKAKELGQPIYELTSDELKIWQEFMKPVTEEWIKETEAKGWNAKGPYDYAKKLIAAGQ